MLSEKVKVELLSRLVRGLNPCFNGICSLSAPGLIEVPSVDWLPTSLNPCFNGICSLSFDNLEKVRKFLYVLILVLMEYAL